MESDVVKEIASILQRAAIRRRVVAYATLHGLFAASEPLSVRYQALADAARLLGGEENLDYGVLMSLDSGLPGEEFFIRFRRHRASEFESVMGAGSLGRSRTRRRILAERERARVYEHATRTVAKQRL